MKRLVPSLLIGLVLLTDCAKQGGSHARTRPSPPPIPTAAVRSATIHAKRTISGIIAPFENVAVSSSLVEPTLSVAVNEGDHVRRGQIIALLDTTDLRANLAQAQSTVDADLKTAASADAKTAQARYQAHLNIDQSADQVKTARAALAQSKQTLWQAHMDLERDRGLVIQGYIAQQAVDQQETTMRNDADQVRSAQAGLESAITNEQVNGTTSNGLQAANIQSALADARAAHATVGQAVAQTQQYQAQIDKATIVSPIDGVIVNRNLNPGEYPGGRTLFTIQELDHVYAELNASSSDTFTIPVSAAVTISVSQGTSHTYGGKVVAVLGQVTPGSTNFTVKVLLDNDEGKLQSGLPVTASISLPPVQGPAVPTTAFLDDTHTTLMIAEDQIDDVVAKTVTVHELASDGTTSVVSGLKLGTKIITNGQLGITDGQSLAQS